MPLASTRSVAFLGVSAEPIEVEVNIGAGLPGVHIVGLADTAVSEARERMKTAIINSELGWPKTKITLSLSPASLRKKGAHYDLAMALGILAAAQPSTEVHRRLSRALILGELGLDGRVRRVPGVLAALRRAEEEGMRTVILPQANEEEAALFRENSVEILLADHLIEAWRWACGVGDLGAPRPRAMGEPGRTHGDMRDVVGQPELVHAAEVAAAGGHHLMLIGPPGSGKSMLAARLPSILPPLTPTQCIDATIIHSLSGGGHELPVRRAPFVAPHHSVTRAALLGGGSGYPTPGAVSLAHHGILFLDEVSEIPAAILDALRTPLDQGEVRIIRSRRECVLPARCQLVLAANPCRCGAETPAECRCRATERQRYLQNLSGPLRDRIDIIVRSRSGGQILAEASTPSSAEIAERVAAARERSAHRWARAGVPVSLNAHVDPHLLRREHPADEPAMALLGAHLAQRSLTQRGVSRTLTVAWTLCDLDGAPRPDIDHMARAIDLHEHEGKE